MPQLLGYEVPEGTKITDLYHWSGFSEWAESQGHDLSNPMAPEMVDLFEAFVEGGFQEWERRQKSAWR